MRHGRKSRYQKIDGYKRHILKDLDIGVVRAVAVTRANTPEAAATVDLEVDLKKQQVQLNELHIDRAYLSSHWVKERAEQLQIFCKAWPVRNSGRFDKNAFVFDWENKVISCPNQVIMPFEPGKVVNFPKPVCATCPLRERCTTNGSPDFMVYNVTNNTFILMDFYLDYILDLPGVKVESCTQIDGKILLGLRIVGEGMVCHHCQNYTEQLHQNRPILVRDLPVFGRPVYLKVPRRQFYCPNCQRYPTEKVDFLDIKRRHTQRYEQNIYERVKQSSMEQIGREEGLSYDEIKGIFDRTNKNKKRTNWKLNEFVKGEISMRKGQGNFVTVVGDISEGNLIEMIDSHRCEEIIEVLMQQAIEVREQVEEVSVDMWGGFPKVIKKVFPNAKIIIDRFHVMKVVNKDLNKLRRAAGITDRQSKYLLLSNRINLNPLQIDKLEMALGKSECLRIAYEMKEKFREIYETNLTVKKGQAKIKEWLNHAQVFFREAASTIENHFEGICNYFLNRTTSGVMEGINNRIKLIMRQGYGFSNFNNFRNRVLACFSD